MMNYKGKTLIILSICFISTLSYSQVNLSLIGGLNLSNQIYSGFPIDVETESILTYKLGGIAGFNLFDKFLLETGLLFNVKGAESNGQIEFRSTINYIQIPLVLSYKLNNFCVGLGAYGSYGIGGTNEDNGQNQDLSLGETVDDHYSPKDFGLIGQIGYRFNKFKVSLSYEYGLANITPKDFVDIVSSGEIYNDVYGISISYYIK